MARRLTCFVSAKIVCFEVHVVDLQLALSCSGRGSELIAVLCKISSPAAQRAAKPSPPPHGALRRVWPGGLKKKMAAARLTWVMRRRMHAQLVCSEQVQEGRLAGIVQTQEQNLGVLRVQACITKLPHPQRATSTGPRTSCDVAAEGAAARGALGFEGDGDNTNQSTTATR